MGEPPMRLPREAGVAADAFRRETDMIECRYTPTRGVLTRDNARARPALRAWGQCGC